MLVRQQVKVRLQLLIEIIVELACSNQSLDTREEFGEHRFP